jgi:hypothetical protein
MPMACLLGERPEDEFTLGDANVRDFEALVVELDAVVQEDVEVDVAGALVYELLAAQGVFNGLEGVQELQRLEGGLDLTGGSVTGTRRRHSEEANTARPRLTNLAGAVDKSILV